MLLDLSVEALITILTILSIFVLLLVTKLPADFVFLGGITVLLMTGVLDAKQAFAGFSSSTVIVIGLLFVVIAGLIHTGVLRWIVKHTLGKPKNHSRAILKIMAITAALSAFLNNTVVVALFVNVVKIWSKKLNLAPSKLLIPLSYAAGMGGICTLIGTPPNMIISELYARESGEALGFFCTALPGLFCLVVGVLSTIAMRRLLPDRSSGEHSFEQVSNYTVEFLVPTDNQCVGKTLHEAGLDKIEKGHLIEIVRFDKEELLPAGTDEFIFGGDRLIFSGDIEELLEMRDKFGFVNATEHVFHADKDSKNAKVVTAYVPFRSRLVGKTMSESGLEASHDFVLAAVARSGQVVRQSPREVVLEPGDTLLMMSGKHADFDGIGRNLHFFDSESIQPVSKKALVSSAIMIMLVALSALEVISLLQACMVACMATLITRCCTVEQARKSVDWSILMIFASSIALGSAITETGIAQMLSDSLLILCGQSPLMVLIVLCLLGTFITEFISNTACAAIFFPIAYESAIALGANPVTFCIALMISVSSSFATPIGSPTHMLVYGPGGYRFADFIRIGLPMNLIMLAANIFITTLLFPL